MTSPTSSSASTTPEQAAGDLPHRAKYLLLVIAHLRRMLELHLELVDEVERELAEP